MMQDDSRSDAVSYGLLCDTAWNIQMTN